MRAAFFRTYGPPEVLEYGELSDPVPGPGEVLVDIHAASVNAADWKMRAGQYAAKVALPHIPGRDFSGVVAATGSAARDFQPGETVFGVCELPAAQPAPPVEFYPYTDVPKEAVETAKRIVKAAGLDVGGIEYLETPDGRRVFYDVNANSNLRPSVASAFGFDPFERVVDFLTFQIGVAV